MATYLDNLIARRDAVAAELAALDSTKAGGKANSMAAGVDHAKYKEGLYAELESLEKRITMAQSESDGPVNVESEGY